MALKKLDDTIKVQKKLVSNINKVQISHVVNMNPKMRSRTLQR